MKRSIVLLLALFLTAAACGGSEEETPAESGAGAEQPEATNSVDITMQDFAFAVDGEPTAGPLTVMFQNEGEAIHHGILGQITGGKTVEDVEAALEKGLDGPPPPWFDDTPLDMTLVSPGESSGVTFEATEGLYVLICFMPGPDNKSHYEHGMWTTFEVAAGEGEAPEPDAEVSMTEEGIEAPEGLTSGTSVLAVTNEGKIDMETFVLKLEDGKKLEDIDAFFNEGAQGTAPATFYGGTHTFPPGETALLTFDLQPGDYELLASYEDKEGKVQDLPTEFTVGE